MAPFFSKPENMNFDKAEREAARVELEKVQLEDDTVASFLLEQAKETASREDDALRSLDGKAASIIGFSGTIVGVVAIFGKDHAPTILTYASAFFLFCAIGFSMACLFVERFSLPSVGQYNFVPTLKDTANKARLAEKLTENWAQYAADAYANTFRKGNLVTIATYCFLAGVVLVFVSNAAPKFLALPGTAAQEKTATVQCTDGSVLTRPNR